MLQRIGAARQRAAGTGRQLQQRLQAADPAANRDGNRAAGRETGSRNAGRGRAEAFQFPSAATKTLANGLRVFVVTDHSEPAIAAQLVIISAGSIQDPPAMPGVAQMTANMLTQGTEKRSAQDIAEAIDFVGGSLGAAAGKDATTVSLNIVKKDLDLGFDLMSDVVLHPAFQAEELERQRQQLLSGLTVQYSDPDYLASVVFTRVVYNGSPYGLPGEGTAGNGAET